MLTSVKFHKVQTKVSCACRVDVLNYSKHRVTGIILKMLDTKQTTTTEYFSKSSNIEKELEATLRRIHQRIREREEKADSIFANNRGLNAPSCFV